MKKSIIALFVVLALLSACANGSGGGGGHGGSNLKHISAGSGSYMLTGSTSGASKSIQASIIKADAASGTTGKLVRVSGSSAQDVTFYDDSGSAVTVAVDHAIALSNGRLVLGLIYDSADLAYIASPSDGSIIALSPGPAGWDYARESGGYLYYVASDGLYKASLTDGMGVRMSAAGASVDAGAWLYVLSTGAVIAQGSGSATLTYYAGGGAAGVADIGIPDPTAGYVLEGFDGKLYQILFYDMVHVTYGIYEENAAHDRLVSGSGNALCALPWTIKSHMRASPHRSTHDLTIATDGGMIRVYATNTGIAYSVTPVPAAISGLAYPSSFDSYTVSEGATTYHAFHEIAASGPGYDVTKYHIWSIEGATPVSLSIAGLSLSSASATTGELIVDYNVGSLAAVGGLLFYTRNNGSGIETMVYNGTSSSEYASGSVSIAPVY